MKDSDYDYEKQISAGYYNIIYRQKAGIRYCWHDLKFHSFIACLGSARTVLEVGCGPGTFIGNYLDGIEALGIDLSALQVEYANRPTASETEASTRACRPTASLPRSGSLRMSARRNSPTNTSRGTPSWRRPSASSLTSSGGSLCRID